jgi:hypothetical protein
VGVAYGLRRSLEFSKGLWLYEVWIRLESCYIYSRVEQASSMALNVTDDNIHMQSALLTPHFNLQNLRSFLHLTSRCDSLVQLIIVLFCILANV